MEIDYKKFNGYSQETQREIISFSRKILHWIEMFDFKKDGNFRLSDFEKGNFDLQKLAAQRDKLNEILGNQSIEIFNKGIVSGWGPRNNRRLTVDIDVKYEPDTPAALKSFLNKVSDRKKEKSLIDSILNGSPHDKVLSKIIFANKLEGVSAIGKNHTINRKIVHIDKKRGIFCEEDGGNRVTYPHLRPNSKIFKIILYMMDDTVFSLKQLTKHTQQEAKTVKTAIKRFNKTFLRIFNVNHEPIIFGEVNYELDRKHFDFI